MRGRGSSKQLFADVIPGDTKPIPLTTPVLMFAAVRAVAVAIAVAIAFGLDVPNADWMPVAALVAMRSSLEQSRMVAGQRLFGTIIGALVAALLLVAVDDKTALEVVVVLLGPFAAMIRASSYTWYCATVAALVLIAMDLPNPSDLTAEGRRVLFTFVGVGVPRRPARQAATPLRPRSNASTADAVASPRTTRWPTRRLRTRGCSSGCSSARSVAFA